MGMLLGTSVISFGPDVHRKMDLPLQWPRSDKDLDPLTVIGWAAYMTDISALKIL